MKSIWLFVLCTPSILLAQPSLRWVEFHPPAYPHLAKLAHIQGEASIEITVSPKGDIVTRPIKGQPLLMDAAMESIKQSKVACENCAGKSAVFVIIFDFRFGEGLPCEGSRASLMPANHVAVVTGGRCITTENTDRL